MFKEAKESLDQQKLLQQSGNAIDVVVESFWIAKVQWGSCGTTEGPFERRKKLEVVLCHREYRYWQSTGKLKSSNTSEQHSKLLLNALKQIKGMEKLLRGIWKLGKGEGQDELDGEARVQLIAKVSREQANWVLQAPHEIAKQQQVVP